MEKKRTGSNKIGDDIDINDAIDKLENRYRRKFVTGLIRSLVELAIVASVIFMLVKQCT